MSDLQELEQQEIPSNIITQAVDRILLGQGIRQLLDVESTKSVSNLDFCFGALNKLQSLRYSIELFLDSSEEEKTQDYLHKAINTVHTHLYIPENLNVINSFLEGNQASNQEIVANTIKLKEIFLANGAGIEDSESRNRFNQLTLEIEQLKNEALVALNNYGIENEIPNNYITILHKEDTPEIIPIDTNTLFAKLVNEQDYNRRVLLRTAWNLKGTGKSIADYLTEKGINIDLKFKEYYESIERQPIDILLEILEKSDERGEIAKINSEDIFLAGQAVSESKELEHKLQSNWNDIQSSAQDEIEVLAKSKLNRIPSIQELSDFFNFHYFYGAAYTQEGYMKMIESRAKSQIVNIENSNASPYDPDHNIARQKSFAIQSQIFDFEFTEFEGGIYEIKTDNTIIGRVNFVYKGSGNAHTLDTSAMSPDGIPYITIRLTKVTPPNLIYHEIGHAIHLLKLKQETTYECLRVPSAAVAETFAILSEKLVNILNTIDTNINPAGVLEDKIVSAGYLIRAAVAHAVYSVKHNSKVSSLINAVKNKLEDIGIVGYFDAYAKFDPDITVNEVLNYGPNAIAYSLANTKTYSMILSVFRSSNKTKTDFIRRLIPEINILLNPVLNDKDKFKEGI